MSHSIQRKGRDNVTLTRRWLLKAGVGGAAALSVPTRIVGQDDTHPSLEQALQNIEPYFTSQAEFQDVSRGRPKPHSLDDETRRAVGLTRDTWSLEVHSDPEHPALISNPLTVDRSTQFRFADLMELAKTRSVRFPKVMTCLNIGCPLGMGIWEGVPLRDVVWRTRPTENLRRVFYYGYHNDDPAQMFRSSLPIGRILEDPFDLPPVILCYKLNGEWLSPERGGPVRIVVPEAYGFKSIKWLSHVVLSNAPFANDTYAGQNNDIDSPLKTFSDALTIPEAAKPNEPFAVTGYAQVGISGLSKVQVWFEDRDDRLPNSDNRYTDAPWMDARILEPPPTWGGEYDDRPLPDDVIGFDPADSQPMQWPLPLAKAHWVYLCPGLPAGRYFVRSRTIDQNSEAQPMPRPFRKSGHATITRATFEIA